jgi:uncharacterized protein (TIGR02145 family)
MKKCIFYSIILLTVSGVFISCEPNKDDPDPINSEVKVSLPDNLEEFDLEYENPTKSLAVEWEIEEGLTYEFLVSLSVDMSSPASVTLNTSGKDALTHQQLDSIMAVLGVKIYKNAELYWVIKGYKDNNSVSSIPRSMKLWRFIYPFVDPRDGEVYRVCKVVDEMTGNYWIWMADNMRCKKYSDGTPLDLVSDVKFLPDSIDDSVHMKEWNRLRGGYYTWVATVRDVTAAESGNKVQGIAPVGWHIATIEDWRVLLSLQEDNSQPGTYLKDGNFWAANAQNFGTNTSGLNIVATGYFWDPLSIREPKNILQVDQMTFFWASTVPKDGDVIPNNPPPADFPTKAYTRGFVANSPGVSFFIYNRLRGYNVRCVLD